MTLPHPPKQAPAGINMTVHHTEGMIVEYDNHERKCPTPTKRIVACAGETGATLTG
jgi:hypothetical protein